MFLYCTPNDIIKLHLSCLKHLLGWLFGINYAKLISMQKIIQQKIKKMAQPYACFWCIEMQPQICIIQYD